MASRLIKIHLTSSTVSPQGQANGLPYSNLSKGKQTNHVHSSQLNARPGANPQLLDNQVEFLSERVRDLMKQLADEHAEKLKIEEAFRALNKVRYVIIPLSAASCMKR
jgi:hypothetical protein